MMFKVNKWTCGFLLLSMALSVPAYADDSQLVSMVQEMQGQMKQMQKTIDRQDDKIHQLESRGPASSVASAGSGEAAAPMSDYEFNQRLDAATGGAQKWLKDLSFKGDMRLRYEAFHNHSGAPTEQDDRNRFRYRLRYGFEKKFSDEMLTGFSMASGEANANSNGFNEDPTSTNQTLTNDFNFKNIWIEKAYATYMPNWAKVGPISKLTITGGKFDNPFEKGSSDLVWDRDVKPEGIIEKADFNLLANDDVTLTGWLTSGQMPVKENGTHVEGGVTDAQLFAEQLGLNATLYTPFMDRPVEWTTAGSFYSWNHYAKDANFCVNSSVTAGTCTSGSLARGNSNSVGSGNALDVASFQIFEAYNEIAVSPFGVPFRPYFDVAHNFQGEGITGMTGDGDNTAWGTGLKIGGIVKKGDWEGLYQYKYIGANAVPGFNDSDFGTNGHSNVAGSVLKFGYALTDYMTLNLGMYFVHNLNTGSPNTNTTTIDEQQRRFQTDLVWKF